MHTLTLALALTLTLTLTLPLTLTPNPNQALRTLLTEVENNRNSLCVVLAGYKDAMMCVP